MTSSIVVFHPAKLFVTLYLIVFLIGGGRVCGCESLSWIGIDVHQTGGPDSSECCHHHEHDEHDHSDTDDQNDHHPVKQEPIKPGDCCDLSLVQLNADQPKKLSLPEFAVVDFEFPLVIDLISSFEIRQSQAADRHWLHPPPGMLFPACSEMLITHQRFNL